MFIELNGEQVANLHKLMDAVAIEAERLGHPKRAAFWREVQRRLGVTEDRKLIEAPEWAQFFGGRVSKPGEPKLVRYQDITKE